LDTSLRHPLVSEFEEKLLAVAIFLALEAPLAAIAYHASRRARPLVLPLSLLAMAVLVPDPSWAGLALFLSLMSMFGVAIRARAQKTVADEKRQLAAHGPSPWLGQGRRSSLMLIATGIVGMFVGMATDGAGQTSSPLGILFFFGGSVMLGMGLFRRHTVLVHYLGRSRARRLEVVQVATAFVVYGLATTGEFSRDPGWRLVVHLLCFLPFAFHFVVVWIPLAKAQERPALPEVPFA
jgi:hypothetical protein